MSLRLIGYEHSIYCWSVRFALAELGLVADWQAANPFDTPVADHPFGLVPVLLDGDFRIYETVAILQHLFDDAQTGRAATRARQVAAIADGKAYWPLVRQVYAQGVVRVIEGLDKDQTIIAEGLSAAKPVLSALEDIAAEGHVLAPVTDQISATDCHLAPMIAAFASYEKGRDMLSQYSALSAWFASITTRKHFCDTAPKHAGGQA